MYVERDSRKQVLGKVENTGELEYLSRCLELLVSTMVDAVPRLCSTSTYTLRDSVCHWACFLLVTGLARAVPSRSFLVTGQKISHSFSCPVSPGQARFLTG